MKIRKKINSNRMSSNSTLADLSRLGVGYGIAIALGILVLITTITLASYVCVRVYSQSQPGAGAGHVTAGEGAGPRRGDQGSSAGEARPSVAGLDQATLDAYPKILYSKSKRTGGNSCCSICLSDYKEAEALRVLPDCGHMFHVTCIDAWLRGHATCPMCRTSPLPSPLSTPLSEVVPLAVLPQR